MTMTTVNVSQRHDGTYVYRTMRGLHGQVLAERHSRRLYRTAVVHDSGSFRLTNAGKPRLGAGEFPAMVLGYGALAYWEPPATVHVTVYHNLSPDGSFGLNTVLRNGVLPPKGVRSTPLEDGRFAWTEEATKHSDQHPLVAVYATDMPSADVANTAWDAFNAVGDWHAPMEDQAYFARRLRSLMTGDVLRLDFPEPRGTEFWSVESGGFRQRDPAEVRRVAGKLAEPLVRQRYGLRPGEPLTVSVPLTWVHTPEGMAAAKAAMAQLGAELTANADALGAALEG